MKKAPSNNVLSKPHFRPIAGFFSVAKEGKQGQSRLGPPMNEAMSTAASIQYRVGYQRHRAGGAKGSEGEAPQNDKASTDSMSSALLLEALAGEVLLVVGDRTLDVLPPLVVRHGVHGTSGREEAVAFVVRLRFGFAAR